MSTSTLDRPSFAADADRPFDTAVRDRFLRDGFMRLDNVIDDDEIARLGEIYDKLFADDSLGESYRKDLGGGDDDGRKTLPQILMPSKTFPELLEMKYVQRVREFAAHIFGQDVRKFGEHMILKPAGYGVETPWHQDQSYHPPDKLYRTVNFWLPLDGATVEGGCMHFVRGSHRGVVVPHEFLVPGDQDSAMVAQDQNYWSLNGTPVPCPRRSCTLHHSYCMHYAGPNTSDLDRRAFIIVFGLEPEPLEQPYVFPWRA